MCIGKKKVLTNLVITQKDEEKERKTIDKYMQTSLYCLVRYKMNKQAIKVSLISVIMGTINNLN